MKKLVKLTLGTAVLVACGLSHAAPVYTTVDGGPVIPLAGNDITDTFRGPASLSAGACSLNCTLTATGKVSDTGTHVQLDITSANSTGSLFLCSLVSFSGFPWSGSVPHSALPSAPGSGQDIEFEVGTVQVNSPCGSCSGFVDVTFNHNVNGLAYFKFDGIDGTNCTVDGQLTSVNNIDYDIWNQ